MRQAFASFIHANRPLCILVERSIADERGVVGRAVAAAGGAGMVTIVEAVGRAGPWYPTHLQVMVIMPGCAPVVDRGHRGNRCPLIEPEVGV